MPERSKRWSLRGQVSNIKERWRKYEEKAQISDTEYESHRQRGYQEQGTTASYTDDGYSCQDQSGLDFAAYNNTTSIPFEESSPLSCSANGMTLASDFRFAALQPAPSMIPNLQQAIDVRSTHLDYGDLDASSITPSPFVSTEVQVHDQAEHAHDSAHTKSLNSYKEIATRDSAKEQGNNCQRPADVSPNENLVEEQPPDREEKLNNPTLKGEAEMMVAIPRPLSGTGLQRSKFDSGSVAHQEPEAPPSPPVPEANRLLTIRNPTTQDCVEESCHTKAATTDQTHSDASQPLSKVGLPVPTPSQTSSRRSEAAASTPSLSRRRYTGQVCGFQQLSPHEVQMVEANRRKNERYLEQHESDRRAALETNLRRTNLEVYEYPSEEMSSLHERSSKFYAQHRHSTNSMPLLHSSRSHATLQGMETAGEPPFYHQAHDRHAQSAYNLCHPEMSLAFHDPHLNQSMMEPAQVSQFHLPLQRGSKPHVDAQSISSRSRISDSDRTSIRSVHSMAPSMAPSSYSMQQTSSVNPSSRRLRYPGSLNYTPRSFAVHNKRSVADPYTRPFTGFSGDYAQSPQQRPHSIFHPPADHMSEAEFLRHDPYAQYQGGVYPYQFNPYAQSVPDIYRPSSLRSVSSYGRLHHQEGRGVVPPGGPLIRDVMTPSSAPRGQSPNTVKGIPKLECASNVSMASSWDKNGDHIGFHYEPPDLDKSWQGGVHAVDEYKRQKSMEARGRAWSMRDTRGDVAERPPAAWKTPRNGPILEEGEVQPDGRGYYGWLVENDAQSRSRTRSGVVSFYIHFYFHASTPFNFFFPYTHKSLVF